MDGPDYRRGQGGLSEQSSATPDPGWVTFDRWPAPGRVMGRRVPVRDGAADEQRAVRMLRTIEGYLISTAPEGSPSECRRTATRRRPRFGW